MITGLRRLLMVDGEVGERLTIEPRKGWLIYVINFAQ